MRSGPLEITDPLWQRDGDGRHRTAVRSEAVDLLKARGRRNAARLVARMPVDGDRLDPGYVAELGRRVHCELQRLSEELQFGRRVAATLTELLAPIAAPSVRVVDVGCGLGFVLRSLAAGGASSVFGRPVKLVGVDLNPVLISEAARLARTERLDVEFVCADALAPGGVVERPDATLVMSSGLLHHLSEDELTAFFSAQTGLGVAAFAHWDIAPCLWSSVGAWFFHQARMREPVSRHDGVLSARRAHPAATLLRAAAGATRYEIEVREGPRWRPRALDVLRPVVGVRS